MTYDPQRLSGGPGQLAYRVRKRGRATWLTVRHLGNGNLHLHWISTMCRATANPEVVLRLAWGTRRPDKRARPGSAETTVAELQNGELPLDDFPKGVEAILSGGFSNYELLELLGGCNQPAPYWAIEPEPLWSEHDDDHGDHWRDVGVAEAPDGSGAYVILPSNSRST